MEEKLIEEQKKLLENPTVVRILELKKDGLSDGAISRISDFPWSQQSVSEYVNKCINAGLITKEEIEKAIAKRKEMEKKNDPNRKKVLKGLRAGKTDKMIAEETTVGEAQVNNIRNSLIQEGVITKQKIEEARKKRKLKEEQEKKETLYVATEEEVLHFLISGYDNFEVRKEIPKLDTKQYTKTINKLVKEKKITREEIKTNREKRAQRIRKEMLEELKAGRSLRYIADYFSFDRDRVKTYIKRIKEEENITDEDIAHWKDENESSVKSKKEFVLKGLQYGWSNIEISKNYSGEGMVPSNVVYYRNILIEEKEITEKEIEQYKKLREEREKKENLDISEFDRKVLSYLENGYERSEIVSLTEKEPLYIKGRIDYLRRKEKFTSEQLKETRRKRKIQRITEIKREIDAEVRFDRKISKEKEEKIREYLHLCFEVYGEEKISQMEFMFFKQAMNKIQVNDKEIMRFAKISLDIGEYNEALIMVRNKQQAQLELSKSRKLRKLEATLDKVSKVQKATQIIRKGNADTAILSNITGLSKDEINILKIRLARKPIRILNMAQRRKVLEALAMNKDIYTIKKQLEMTDFEAEDIKEQELDYIRYKAKCKELKKALEKSSQDIAKEAEIEKLEKEMEQKIRVRIIVLYTKLGRNPETIAKVLKRKPKEVEEDIKIALEQGELIKQNELQGINPLDVYKSSNLKDIIK